MFNTNSGYSLADIAAATGGARSDMGWGDGGAWWIIILFLFCFAGGWGNNYGGGLFGGGAGATGSGITDGYILTSDFATLERKIDSVNNGLCDGFYSQAQIANGLQQSITQGTIDNMQNTNQLMSQLNAMEANRAACCCETNNLIATNFGNLKYDMATQACQTRQAIADSTSAILANQDANTRSILDFLTQDKIASLQAENQSLKFAASQAEQNNYLIRALQPAPVPAYTVPNPYASYANGCGCYAAC